MNKKLKIVAAFLCFAMLLTSVFAESNTAKSTAGVFKNDIDYFNNVNKYTKLEMEKWFGYTGIRRDDLDLGYATKLGSLYLGAEYKGKLLSQNGFTDTISVSTTPIFDGPTEIARITTTNKTYDKGQLFTENTGAVLVGFGNMGIKLSVKQDGTSDKSIEDDDGYVVDDDGYDTKNYYWEKEDTDDQTKTVKEYTDIVSTTGNITPKIEWGMALDLKGMLLSPRAALAVAIGNEKDAYKYSETNTFAGSTAGRDQIERSYLMSKAFIGINPTIGADLALVKTEEKQVILGLDYELDLPIYVTSYFDAENAKLSAKGTVTGSRTVTVKETTTEKETTKETTIDWKAEGKEQFEMTHRLRPSVKTTFVVTDRLNLGASAAIGLGFITNKDTAFNLSGTKKIVDSKSQDPADSSTTTVETTKQKEITDTTTIEFKPVLSAGLQYQIIKDKLRFNSGLSVNLPQLTSTKTLKTTPDLETKKTKEVNGNGEITVDEVNVTVPTTPREETSTETTTWSPLGATFSAGLTWDLTPKAAFDVGLKAGFVGADADGNTVQSFWASTMESSLDLQFTIKF